MLFFGKKKKAIIVEETIMENGLPFGWYHKNRDFVNELNQKEAYFFSLEKNAKTVKEKISALKSKIQFYKDAEQYSKNLGKYHEIYFENQYFGNENFMKAFCKWKEELKYIEDNYDKLIKEEKIRNKEEEIRNDALPTLENEIISIIMNNPGIKQTDLYKEFHECLKNDISHILYHLSKEGNILREKAGNTYTLTKRM